MSALAGNIKVPDQHFFLEIKSRHGKPEWYKVYQRGKEWICQTESNPFYKAKGNPLAHLDWKALGEETKSTECKFGVHIRDTRSRPAHDVEGCARKNEALHQLIEDLNASCRAG
ncbi:MAG: hypothetical protein ACJ763_16775 [Bdellovibrionia bacterium]